MRARWFRRASAVSGDSQGREGGAACVPGYQLFGPAPCSAMGGSVASLTPTLIETPHAVARVSLLKCHTPKLSQYSGCWPLLLCIQGSCLSLCLVPPVVLRPSLSPRAPRPGPGGLPLFELTGRGGDWEPRKGWADSPGRTGFHRAGTKPAPPPHSASSPVGLSQLLLLHQLLPDCASPEAGKGP